MKKKMASLAVIGLISVATLSACGSKSDVNETNFKSAVAQYYEKKGDLCLGATRWPIVLSESRIRDNDRYVQKVKALEAIGLIKGEETEEVVTPTFKRKAVRYTLTDAAKPYIQETIEDEKKFIDLCWGKKRVDKVVKWLGPKVSGNYQEALVIHTYKVIDVANWAKKPEIQAAFPEIKKTLDEAGKNEVGHPVVLTSLGWESARLN
jgi:hypothetical protein